MPRTREQLAERAAQVVESAQDAPASSGADSAADPGAHPRSTSSTHTRASSAPKAKLAVAQRNAGKTDDAQPDTTPAPTTSSESAQKATRHATATPATAGTVTQSNPLAAIARRIKTTYFNSSPTASPRQDPVQSTPGVLTGDVGASDPDDDPLAVSLKTGPTKAGSSVVVNPNGTYIYTPSAALAATGGTDSFTVTVRETNAASHIHGAAQLVNAFLHAITGGAVPLNDGSSITVTVPVAVPTPTTVTTTIPAQQSDSPQWIAFNASGSRAYVTNQGSASVSVIDTATNTVVTTITDGIGDQPTIAALAPNGKIYVSNQGSGTVSVIDTTTDTVITGIAVGGHPLGFAFGPGGVGYVAGGSGQFVAIIDTTTNTVVDTIPLGGNPAQVELRPNTSHLYVTNQFAGTVSVIDTATDELVSTIPTGIYPTIIKFNNAGTLAYVTTEFSNAVDVIDTATNAVVRSIPVGVTPIDLHLSTDGTHAYVTNFSGLSPGDLHPGTVSVINLVTDAVTNIEVGVGPVGSAVTPDGTRLYVVNSSGSISVINLNSVASL